MVAVKVVGEFPLIVNKIVEDGGMCIDLESIANTPFSSAILDCGGRVMASENSLLNNPVN